MLAVRKLALFIDRSHKQWIVRDPDGNFWSVPGGDNAWDLRQPYDPTDEADLEPIPAHYRYALGLPE
jgi:hypothetical protein